MEKGKKYVAMWSGGKDSSFMVDELLRRECPLDEVIFVDTGFEFPEMYEYVEKCKGYWEDIYDVKITLLNYGQPARDIYNRWADTPYTRGRYRGQVRGFPFHIGMCWCTRELKVLPADKYIAEQYSGYTVYRYLGIAIDEPKRLSESKKTNLYPLAEWNITEAEAEQTLRDRDMLNPLYNRFARTGCWHCPKQPLKSLDVLYHEYPELWEKLVQMEAGYVACGAGVPLFRGVGTQKLEQKLKQRKARKDKK